MIQREGNFPHLLLFFLFLNNYKSFPYGSEPAELLLAMESSANIKGRFAGDGGTRPSRADVVEQWARQSSGHAQRLSSSIQRRGSDSLGNTHKVVLRNLSRTVQFWRTIFRFKTHRGKHCKTTPCHSGK